MNTNNIKKRAKPQLQQKIRKFPTLSYIKMIIKNSISVLNFQILFLDKLPLSFMILQIFRRRDPYGQTK